MSTGYKQFQISVFDDMNKEITPNAVVVYTAGSRTAATVYLDDDTTAIGTTMSAPESSTVTFWSAASTLDLKVWTDDGTAMVYGITPGATPVVCDRTDYEFAMLDSFHQKYVVFFDDFFGLGDDDYLAVTESTELWNFEGDSGGTATIDDAADGVLSLLSGATDEDGATLSSVSQCFLCQTDKNIYFEARVKLTEAATDDANICVGLADIVTVDLMQDAGAGPAATLDGITFSKLDGNLYWDFETSNAGAVDVNSDMVAFVSGTWYVLAFKYDCNGGTIASVTPYVNGTAYDALTLTISGMAEMAVVLSVKAGGSNAETLKVDYVRVVADRDD